MTEVFREVSFTYRGQEMSLVPSIGLLRRIKSAGINNMELAQACLTGKADPLDVLVALKLFVQEATKEDEIPRRVPEDEGYAWIMSGQVSELQSFMTAYTAAVLPGIDLGKKPDARGQTKTPRKPRAKKTKS